MAETSCPVFRPSAEEFLDFFGFVQKVEKEAAAAGICKVIPPPEWRPAFASWRELTVQHPVRQCISGSRGAFSVDLVELKAMAVQEFLEKAEARQAYVERQIGVGAQRERRRREQAAAQAPEEEDEEDETDGVEQEADGEPAASQENAEASDGAGQVATAATNVVRAGPRSENAAGQKAADAATRAALEAVERYFWRRLGPTMEPPLYGADMQGSLFPEPVEHPRTVSEAWNLRDLPSLLRLLPGRIGGINTPMLYVGMFASLFAFHTEDADLFSINYLHTGAPKSWYSLPRAQSARLESVASSRFADKSNDCREYLRHKTSLLSPQTLRRAGGLRLTTVVQFPGEFVLTMPGAYHAGFNHGFNVAEATNFATPDWLRIGAQAGQCRCNPDCVRLDVESLERLWLARQAKLSWANGVSLHSEEARPAAGAMAPRSGAPGEAAENPMLSSTEAALIRRSSRTPRRASKGFGDDCDAEEREPGAAWTFGCSCELVVDASAPPEIWPKGEMFLCDLCNVWKHVGCNFPGLALRAEDSDSELALATHLPTRALCEPCRAGVDGTWLFACSCGVRADASQPESTWPDGLTFQCDNCRVWGHADCTFGLGRRGVPKVAFCGPCQRKFRGLRKGWAGGWAWRNAPQPRFLQSGASAWVRQMDGGLRRAVCGEHRDAFIRVRYPKLGAKEDEWIERRSERFLVVTKEGDGAISVTPPAPYDGGKEDVGAVVKAVKKAMISPNFRKRKPAGGFQQRKARKGAAAAREALDLLSCVAVQAAELEPQAEAAEMLSLFVAKAAEELKPAAGAMIPEAGVMTPTTGPLEPEAEAWSPGAGKM